MQIVTYAPATAIMPQVRPSPQEFHFDWLAYFDPYAALEQVRDHVETLPGSRFERHTMRAYLSSLADFCAYLGADVIHIEGENYHFRFETMAMPDATAIKSYMAQAKQRGLSSNTVTRYMAAVRHWLMALESQAVYPKSGTDYMAVTQAQRQFRLALGVKNPPADRTSNRPALEQFGQRLTLAQVNQLFESFSGTLHTVTGKRDLALLYLGITSGLRAAELARLTLDNITPGEDCFEVRVRGKRANYDPVGIDSTAYGLILAYVEAWNGHIPTPSSPDPFSHGEKGNLNSGDTPNFRALLKGDHIPAVSEGLSARAILKIVERRTAAALGRAIAAHDMRRSCAALMRANGFEWDQIQAQLRHKSIATTQLYVGTIQDLSRSLLGKRVTFNVPVDARLWAEVQ